MIEIKGVSKRYGDTEIIKNITTNIKENCLTAFIGSNERVKVHCCLL